MVVFGDSANVPASGDDSADGGAVASSSDVGAGAKRGKKRGGTVHLGQHSSVRTIRALTMSFGSICFRSLLVAILQALKALVNYRVSSSAVMKSGNELHESYTCPTVLPADGVARRKALPAGVLLHEESVQRLHSCYVDGEWTVCVRFAERALQNVMRPCSPSSKSVWTRRTLWQWSSSPVHIATGITAWPAER